LFCITVICFIPPEDSNFKIGMVIECIPENNSSVFNF
jgi:hypothetical protein